jgi:hypothetical protein
MRNIQGIKSFDLPATVKIGNSDCIDKGCMVDDDWCSHWCELEAGQDADSEHDALTMAEDRHDI